MRVVFCGGGTGGHVYPALTVAQALRSDAEAPGFNPPYENDRHPRRDSLEVLYIGVKGRIDAELVEREGIPFKAVNARPLRTGNIAGTAKGALALEAGIAQAYGMLRAFRPDVVFATGGYGSVGVGLAARLLKRPLLLFLPDVEAGLAVKLLAKVADRIAVTVPPALEAMPREKTSLIGYPVRPQFFGVDNQLARERLGLQPALPTLLVSGASTGANRLNRAVADRLREFLNEAQVIHLCGRADEPWLREEREALPFGLRERYHLYGYLHDDIAHALAAADVAVMRSGASVLGELPATRLPAILVPGEYEGWDQSPNARYLESEGAAIMLAQSRLESGLQRTVMDLMHDEQRLQSMREALAGLARPGAARDLARLLREMAGMREKVAV